jgi:hypothetical protein
MVDSAVISLCVAGVACSNFIIFFKLKMTHWNVIMTVQYWNKTSFQLYVLFFLFSRFPSDVHTYSIDEQFLWGSALMIVPVLEEVRKF